MADLSKLKDFLERHAKLIKAIEMSQLTQEFYSSENKDAIEVVWPTYQN